MKNISIVIPTRNEEGNIIPLVERIDSVLTSNDIQYEIIFVDDHSTDATRRIIKSLYPRYRVTLSTKIGKQGKGQSLIEGFSYTHYDVICIIDADLQYSPDAIPAMLRKIEQGAAIVVTNRKEKRINSIRTFFSNSYRFLFVRLLHNLPFDSQSGLKLIQKEVLERITLQNHTWALDLELLLNARQAGYRIVSHDILFRKRHSGKSKINLLGTAVELALASLQLRFRRTGIIPFHPEVKKEKGEGFHYKGQEFVHYSTLSLTQSAFHRLSESQIIVLITTGVIFVAGLLINWHATIEIMLAILTGLYFLDLLFNLSLILQSFSKPAEIVVAEKDIQKFEQKSVWPAYTVLCPLYKEWQVVPQFITAMSQLSYPKDKLQVMLLLEEDDTETIAKVRAMHLPSYFDIVIVPHSLPKTKPKACNYGLQFATGEYVVIYDAEDIPDPLQLKKSVVAFAAAGEKTACVQAKLNFYNPYQNVLTRVFTAEYSLWFDLVLTGLQSIQAPIPLGGTSNHFRTNNIRKVKGWDSFNVTEDCDLGMRLVKLGYKTAIIDSITLEEANSDLANWFAQRTRWIKGYMQTYLVHMRQLGDFAKSKRKSHLITFQLVVGGKVLSMFINPVMWLITICYFLFRAHIGPFIESFFPMPVLYMGVFSLVLGNFLYMYYYMIGSAKHGHHQLVKYVVLVPLYWLAMSIAAAMAVYKLITRPHHWSKTKHGLHLTDQKAVNQAIHNVGEELIDDQLVTVGVANALSY